ncbi:DUF305 domain-containing protein [Gordonia soli]|uniref:DUF305 domain-containing protein n=1 Tax=Gordonia soli TaxID=320799 RepID=UPI000348EB1E|nr:DUF305 domain-containing protein [Gordonia soli]
MKTDSYTTLNRCCAIALGGIVATALLAGCGGDGDSASASSSASAIDSSGTSLTEHNNADVEFNSMMIPHHQQAVTMAGLVDERTDTAAVRTLAAEISAAQEPEIALMTARLRSWGVDTTMSDDHSEHAGHGGHGGMEGMLTDDQLAKLRAARGPAFDKLWLEGMIRHHEGAIAMANAEMADGKDAASKVLAQQIAAAQRAEIDRMKKLLGA